MLVGIDVGGTNTDLVVICEGSLMRQVKVRHNNNISDSIFEAVQTAFPLGDLAAVSTINISTTFITNLLAQRNLPPVALVQIPGLGLPSGSSILSAKNHTISGAVNHQGRILEDLDQNELNTMCMSLKQENFQAIGIVGKFSCRNNRLELAVGQTLKEKGICQKIYYGHKIAGRLNFPRRILNTIVHAGTFDSYKAFLNSVKEGLADFGYIGPINILNGDGSPVAIDKAVESPVNSLHSGPAATLLGAKALLPDNTSVMVIDVGGTTTDIGLILNGEPLESDKGIPLDVGYLQGRSFLTYSLPIGGNTPIRVESSKISFDYEASKLPAYFGGDTLTITDILCLSENRGLAKPTNLAWSRNVLDSLAKANQISTQYLLDTCIEQLLKELKDKICALQLHWERTPAYHLWKLLRKEDTIFPDSILALGEAAPSLVDKLAKVLGLRAIVPKEYAVTNALGAALSKPIFRLSFRFDTRMGTYQIPELGEQGTLTVSNLTRTEALTFATERLIALAKTEGYSFDSKDIEVLEEDIFNLVEQGVLKGRIIQLELTTPWSLSFYRKEENSL